MSINESSTVDAGQALAAADNVRARARKLQQTPWWLNVVIIVVMVGTAFLPLPIRQWSQSAAALVLTGGSMWRLRRSAYRPRYYDTTLWAIILVFLANLSLFAVVPAVTDLGLSDRAGEALVMLTAVAFTGLSSGIAFLLTRLALWRVR